MTEIFYRLIKDFTDETVRITTKLFTLIIILISIWFVNDTFDFINSYRTTNKLQHLEKITYLLRDSTLTKSQKLSLIKQRDYVLNHQTKLDYVSSFCDSFFKNISFKSLNKAEKPHTTTDIKIKEPKEEIVPIKNYYLHFIFSNLFLLIIAIAVPIFIIKQTKENIAVIIVSIVATLAALFSLTLFISWILNFIPVIYNRPWINYILDFIIQSLLWIWLLISVARKK